MSCWLERALGAGAGAGVSGGGGSRALAPGKREGGSGGETGAEMATEDDGAGAGRSCSSQGGLRAAAEDLAFSMYQVRIAIRKGEEGGRGGQGKGGNSSMCFQGVKTLWIFVFALELRRLRQPRGSILLASSRYSTHIRSMYTSDGEVSFNVRDRQKRLRSGVGR